MILPSLITDLSRFCKATVSSGDMQALTTVINENFIENNWKEKTLEELEEELRKKTGQPSQPPVPPQSTQDQQPSQMDLLLTLMQQIQTQLTAVQEQQKEDRAMIQRMEERLTEVLNEQKIQNQQLVAVFQATTELYRTAGDAYRSFPTPTFEWPPYDVYMA